MRLIFAMSCSGFSATTICIVEQLGFATILFGMFLSGGLDSSAVCAAALELGFKNVRTFSVGHVDQGKYNETPMAEAVAAHLGFKHRSLILDHAEVYERLEEVVWATDEPLADMATIPLLSLSRVTREDVKVVLSGEGSDEVFAGYNLNSRAETADRWKRRLASAPTSVIRALATLPIGRRQDVLRQIAKHGPAGYLWHWRPHPRFYEHHEKLSLWRPEVFRPTRDSVDLVTEMFEECRSREAVDISMSAAFDHWLVEDLLMKADKITMAASLELRCPFLDHKLVEWAQHLPLTQKTGSYAEGYTTKKIVRDLSSTFKTRVTTNAPFVICDFTLPLARS